MEPIRGGNVFTWRLLSFLYFCVGRRGSEEDGRRPVQDMMTFTRTSIGKRAERNHRRRQHTAEKEQAERNKKEKTKDKTKGKVSDTSSNMGNKFEFGDR